MPISVTNIGTNSTTSATSLAVTVGAGGVPAGSLIVVCAEIFKLGSSPNINTVVDTATNSYNAGRISGHPNNVGTNGEGSISYAFNCLALANTNTITASSTATASQIAVSAFYATGIQTSSDPINAFPSTVAAGSSATPSVQLAGVPLVAGSLVIGAVGTNGPNTDTFTQDSTNGAWATPPIRVGTAVDATIAGGFLVTSAQVTYAPTLGTSRPWTDMTIVFKPAPSVGGQITASMIVTCEDLLRVTPGAGNQLTWWRYPR